MVKKIAAVHDICGFGRCSLTTAIATLSACGLQCCPVPTAVLSGHTGFQGVTCNDLTSTLPEYISSLCRLSTTFDAVYSGYLGSPAQVSGVIELIDTCVGENGLAVVDPVMGDHGKPYRMVLDTNLLPAMLKLCKRAHVITPNITETAMLLGLDPATFVLTVGTAPKYLSALADLGPNIVVITGIAQENNMGACYFCRESGEFGYAGAPKIPESYPGTGDLFTSVLTAALVLGHELRSSVQLACTFVSSCVGYTSSQGTPLVEGVLLEPMLYELINLIKSEGDHQ